MEIRRSEAGRRRPELDWGPPPSGGLGVGESVSSQAETAWGESKPTAGSRMRGLRSPSRLPGCRFRRARAATLPLSAFARLPPNPAPPHLFLSALVTPAPFATPLPTFAQLGTPPASSGKLCYPVNKFSWSRQDVERIFAKPISISIRPRPAPDHRSRDTGPLADRLSRLSGKATEG